MSFNDIPKTGENVLSAFTSSFMGSEPIAEMPKTITNSLDEISKFYNGLVLDNSNVPAPKIYDLEENIKTEKEDFIDQIQEKFEKECYSSSDVVLLDSILSILDRFPEDKACELIKLMHEKLLGQKRMTLSRVRKNAIPESIDNYKNVIDDTLVRIFNSSSRVSNVKVSRVAQTSIKGKDEKIPSIQITFDKPIIVAIKEDDAKNSSYVYRRIAFGDDETALIDAINNQLNKQIHSSFPITVSSAQTATFTSIAGKHSNTLSVQKRTNKAMFASLKDICLYKKDDMFLLKSYFYGGIVLDNDISRGQFGHIE